MTYVKGKGKILQKNILLRNKGIRSLNSAERFPRKKIINEYLYFVHVSSNVNIIRMTAG